MSGRHFDTWWKKAARTQPELLDFTEEMLRTEQAGAVDPEAYPDHVEAGGLTLPLSYAFEPGKRDDGITVDVPAAALHQIDPTPFTWQVPGRREELVTALIKTLPKNIRRLYSPAPDHARAVLARLTDTAEPLLDGLERELGRMRNITIPRDAWELDRLPEHLTVTFRVVDERGREIARGTDLEALRHELAPAVRARDGRRRQGVRAPRAHHVVARHAAAGAADPARLARRHRRTRGWSTAAPPSTCARSPRRPSAIPRTAAACAGCC